MKTEIVARTAYNKDSGYYDIKVEEQQVDDNGQLIEFPWDDDGFSLCLDTFPSSRLARTKINMNPMVASPLRKYWRSSSLSDTNSDEEEEEEEQEDSISSSRNQAATVTGAEQQTRIKKEAQKTKKTFLHIDTCSSFPYNNNEIFLNKIEQKESAISGTSTIKKQQSVSSRGRVEHISPLLNSSLLLQHDKDFQSLTSKKSTSTVKSASSSIISVPGHLRGGSIITESQISDNGIIESWRIAAGPGPAHHHHRRNALSPIINQFPLPPLNIHPHSTTPPPPPPPPVHHYHCQAALPPSRSGSTASNANYTPTSAHSNGYYLPSPSPSVNSYRNVPVARNADTLVYFSETPSSIYSGISSSTYNNQDKQRYSQFFNPSYHSGMSSTYSESGCSSKKKQQKKSSSRSAGKKSMGLFAKLLRNIKNHFKQ